MRSAERVAAQALLARPFDATPLEQLIGFQMQKLIQRIVCRAAYEVYIAWRQTDRKTVQERPGRLKFSRGLPISPTAECSWRVCPGKSSRSIYSGFFREDYSSPRGGKNAILKAVVAGPARSPM
jgi:hypothetical protein